jgi:hypothetical protein
MAHEDRPKEVEFYAASVTAWYCTRLEHDKSLLTLSAGGIGLLIALLTTIGVSSAEGLVLYVLALASFATCLGAVLLIFKENAAHLEAAIKPDAPVVDPLLRRLDNVAVAAFAIGVAFAAVIGVSAAVSSYTKVKAMTDENKQVGKQSSQRSFDGATNMKPSEDIKKSFNGAANLKPTPELASPAPGTAPAQTPAAETAPAQTSTPSTAQNQSGNKK